MSAHNESCTDGEFIELWRLHCSVSRVAKELGIAESNVRCRRRTLEKKYAITLDTRDLLQRPAYNQMRVTDDRVEVKLNITDGVILVSGDQHYYPGIVPVMHKAYVYLSKKLKPFAQIWNGDALDLPTASRHATIGWEHRPTIEQEINCAKEMSKQILDASPNSKRVWNLGNHDMRFSTRLAHVAPEYAKVHGVQLKDHFPEWTPAWFVTVNEGTPSHTEIRHREKGGIHAGYNNTKESGVTLVTGHDHRAEVVPYDDRRGRRYGVRHGMGADSSRDPMFVNYLEARRGNWQSAIAILTYRGGELLQPELALRMDDNHFQFRGEVIEV